MVDNSLFQARIGQDSWTPIMEVPDFNSLIAISQEHQVPVYCLTPEQIGQQGAVLDQAEGNMVTFKERFSECADRIIALTS